jgi:hypothetical protein
MDLGGNVGFPDSQWAIMPRAGDFSYRAKGPALFVFCRLDGLLTGLGPAATINSEPLSDLTLQFRHISID